MAGRREALGQRTGLVEQEVQPLGNHIAETKRPGTGTGPARYPAAVRSVPTEVLAWGDERAQAGPWRGPRRDSADRVAHLTPVRRARTQRVGFGGEDDGGPTPSVLFLRRCLETLAARGYTSVVTPALGRTDALAFAAVGFEEHERLVLLAHDLRHLPPRPAVRLSRIRPGSREEVLAVDAVAFDPAWRLDRAGLDEALAATPAARLRVALHPDGGRHEAVAGYAVTGRAGANGYLQRLAVDPTHRRARLGTSLVVDGLRWLRRHGAHQAYVNTQHGNEAALSLYLRLGFRRQPSDLRVLRFDFLR